MAYSQHHDMEVPAAWDWGAFGSHFALQGDVFQWLGRAAPLPDFLLPLEMCSCSYRGHVVHYQCLWWL